MKNTEEWWHKMFEMHSKLVECLDVDTLQVFMQELDTIPYEYAKPYEVLGIGSGFVETIAIWFDHASQWCLGFEDYDGAVKYLERALDYYCDPMLDYDDDTIDEAKDRMRDIVTHCLSGIYEGSHDIGIES